MRLLHRSAAAALLALPLLASAAPFDGLWCGTGLLHEFSLKLRHLGSAQVEGTLMRRDRTRRLEGNVDGNVLQMQPTKYGSLVLEAAGTDLRIIGGDGPLALARGNAFRRAAGSACSS